MYLRLSLLDTSFMGSRKCNTNTTGGTIDKKRSCQQEGQDTVVEVVGPVLPFHWDFGFSVWINPGRPQPNDSVPTVSSSRRHSFVRSPGYDCEGRPTKFASFLEDLFCLKASSLKLDLLQSGNNAPAKFLAH
jgi:hypothetical protein